MTFDQVISGNHTTQGNKGQKAQVYVDVVVLSNSMH